MASRSVCAVCGDHLGRSAKRLRTIEEEGEAARVRLGVVKLLSANDDHNVEKRLVRAFLRVLQRKGALKDEDDPFVLRAARVLDAVVSTLRDDCVDPSDDGRQSLPSDDSSEEEDDDDDEDDEDLQSESTTTTTTTTHRLESGVSKKASSSFESAAAIAGAMPRLAPALKKQQQQQQQQQQRDAQDGATSARSLFSAVEFGALRLATKFEAAEAPIVATKLVSAMRDATNENRLPSLEPLLRATQSTNGADFVQHFAHLGGLRELLRVMTRAPADEAVQVCGLTVLGHGGLLTNHSISKDAAERGVLATLAAMSRFSDSPQVVGLAALAMANFAQAEPRAATCIGHTGACELLVDALSALGGNNRDVTIAHVAGLIAFSTLATSPTSFGSRVQLVHCVVDAGALEFVQRARADQQSTAHCANAIEAALAAAKPNLPDFDDDGDDERGKCDLQ